MDPLLGQVVKLEFDLEFIEPAWAGPEEAGGWAYGLAVGLAFVVPVAAPAIHAVSAGYYALDQATLDASGRADTVTVA